MSEIKVEDNISLEKLIREVDYKSLEKGYVPSQFAIKFINFIKLVNGAEGEENKSPLFHYRMADNIAKNTYNLFVAFRGSAKSTLMEYLVLYIAVFGKLDGFGDVDLGLYVADTMENGAKNFRSNLEFRWDNSAFLKKFLPETRFTDSRLIFVNAEGHKLIWKLYGATPLSLDSLLYLEDGSTTTIGECKVGDRIYGSDGELTTIQLKSEIFNKPVYKITLNDGRNLKVSEDHINSVVKKTKATGHKQKLEFNNINITTSDLLKEDLFFKNSKENKWFIPTPKAINYPKRDLLLDPYTLGLLIGDGRLRKDGSCNLTGSKNDIEFYMTQIPYNLGSLYFDKRTKDTFNLSIKDISKRIKNLGLCGCHTHNKFIPNEYKTASKQQRLDILRGLLDTDGSVSKRKLRDVVYFSNTSKQLIHDVTDIVRSLGGYTTISKHKAKLYKDGYNRVDSYKCFIHLNEDLFKLPRKRDLQTGKSDKNTRVGIKAIEKIPTEPTQCIGVDNEQHQFVTTDYLVTHNTGVRGVKEMGVRPKIAIFDDLMSDKNANSPAIVTMLEKEIYNSVLPALHPTRKKIIWIGTPFNKKDPLYKAAGSKSWNTLVFPICEKYPCVEKEFIGAWEDRFPLSAIKEIYKLLKDNGKVDAFNQEYMLRILSDDDRLVLDEDIVWYNRSDVLNNLEDYHIYMTTDFATSEKESSDYSVIALWAVDWNGRFHWFDGIVARQDMAKNVDDVFRFVEMYNPFSVGVEISGQQKGFVSWLKRDMLTRNIWFQIASDKTSGEEGLRPTTSKLVRFNSVLPMFKQRKIAFPEELKESAIMLEFMDELTSITPSGIKSLHDDCVDNVSQIPLLNYMNSSNPEDKSKSNNPIPISRSKFFSLEDTVEEYVDSYFV